MKKLFCICSILFSLCSCKKYLAEEYPKGCRCERFAGLYEMYDPHENQNYQMIISCLCNEDGYEDSLSISNFVNVYDFSYGISQQGIYSPADDSTDDNWIDGSYFFGIYDQENHQTALSVGGPWYGFDSNINRLIGDSIFIRYKADNTAFYINEGTAYESIDTFTYGVKVH
ncbi:MAG: hypothetical protein ABJF27_10180 [Crocinitomicaceae bacterium]